MSSLSKFMAAASKCMLPVRTQIIDGKRYAGFEGAGWSVSSLPATDDRGFIKKEIAFPPVPERTP